MKWCLNEFWQRRCCSQAGPLLSSLAGTADIWCDIVVCLPPASAELRQGLLPARNQPAAHCNYSFSLYSSTLSVCSSVCTLGKLAEIKSSLFLPPATVRQLRKLKDRPAVKQKVFPNLQQFLIKILYQSVRYLWLPTKSK